MNAKPDYKRLLEAAYALRGWELPAEIAARLSAAGYEVSEQTMTNWKSRGISKEGRLRASAIIGCRPHWVETGEEPMEDAGAGRRQAKSDTGPRERRHASPQTAAEIASRIASMDLSARDIEFLSRAIDLIAMERRRDPYNRPPSDFIGRRFLIQEPEYKSLAEQGLGVAPEQKKQAG